MLIMLHAYSTLEFLHAYSPTRTSAGLVLPLPSNVEVARHIVPAVYRQCECPHIFRLFPLRAGPLAILPLLSIVPQTRIFSLKLSHSADGLVFQCSELKA